MLTLEGATATVAGTMNAVETRSPWVYSQEIHIGMADPRTTEFSLTKVPVPTDWMAMMEALRARVAALEGGYLLKYDGFTAADVTSKFEVLEPSSGSEAVFYYDGVKQGVVVESGARVRILPMPLTTSSTGFTYVFDGKYDIAEGQSINGAFFGIRFLQGVNNIGALWLYPHWQYTTGQLVDLYAEGGFVLTDPYSAPDSTSTSVPAGYVAGTPTKCVFVAEVTGASTLAVRVYFNGVLVLAGSAVLQGAQWSNGIPLELQLYGDVAPLTVRRLTMYDEPLSHTAALTLSSALPDGYTLLTAGLSYPPPSSA